MQRTKYMDIEEVKRLRTYTELWARTDLEAGRRQGPVAWVLVDLALMTGLRAGELANLQVGDVDLRRSILHVKTLKRRHPVVDELAMPPELIRHLRAFLKWKACSGESYQPGAPLLCGKRGSLTVRGVQQQWQSAIKRAGLPKGYSIKAARHTCGVHLLAKTRDLRAVQKQLRHARVTTTEIYADVTFERMREGVTGLYA